MTDRQINKWLRKQFSLVGWVLLGYYFLMNLMVTATAGMDYLKQVIANISVGAFPFEVDLDAVYNNAWGYAAAIGVGVMILYGWKGDTYWKEELFAVNQKMRPSAFLTAMVLFMGAQMVSSIWMVLVETIMNAFGGSVMPLMESVSGSSSSFSMILYAVLLAPVFEELLFRGYVLRALHPYGKRFSIVVSALLFSMFHGNVLQAPYAFAAGLILAWLTCEYSIRWAIGLHVFNNLVLAEGLTRLLDQLSYETADMLYGILFVGAFLLSCRILITKRWDIRAYNRSEWIDRRCVKCFFTNTGILIFLALMLGSMVSLLVNY